MQFSNNPDINRATGNATDSIIKFIFKWIGIGITTLVNVIKSMISMAVGK